MSIRTTVILVVLLALMGGIAFVYAHRGPSGKAPVKVPNEWFYSVHNDAINKVVVESKEKKATFVTDQEGKWHFDSSTGAPVNIERWGGVTLLLSGPQTSRKLVENPADLTPYGLDKPATVITIGLVGLGELHIRVGEKTPDGVRQYVQVEDSPGVFRSVYLIDGSWADVLTRLVTEPPYMPTPTPESTPEASGTPAAVTPGY